MALFQETEARRFFENMSDAQQTNVIHYIQSNNKTGDEAKAKIDYVIDCLRHHNMNF